MSISKPIKISVIGTTAVILFVYVAGYVLRSLGGRYEPIAIGSNGVKSYAWAPEGFVTNFNWSDSLMRIYQPLYVIDTRIWHVATRGNEAKYPINLVETRDIWKVYEAWKR